MALTAAVVGRVRPERRWLMTVVSIVKAVAAKGGARHEQQLAGVGARQRWRLPTAMDIIAEAMLVGVVRTGQSPTAVGTAPRSRWSLTELHGTANATAVHARCKRDHRWRRTAPTLVADSRGRRRGCDSNRRRWSVTAVSVLRSWRSRIAAYGVTKATVVDGGSR